MQGAMVKIHTFEIPRPFASMNFHKLAVVLYKELGMIMFGVVDPLTDNVGSVFEEYLEAGFSYTLICYKCADTIHTVGAVVRIQCCCVVLESLTLVPYSD